MLATKFKLNPRPTLESYIFLLNRNGLFHRSAHVSQKIDFCINILASTKFVAEKQTKSLVFLLGYVPFKSYCIMLCMTLCMILCYD